MRTYHLVLRAGTEAWQPAEPCPVVTPSAGSRDNGFSCLPPGPGCQNSLDCLPGVMHYRCLRGAGCRASLVTLCTEQEHAVHRETPAAPSLESALGGAALGGLVPQRRGLWVQRGWA